MKTKNYLSLFFLLLGTAITHAGVPQPMCIFYGQAKNGFGWPYTSSADVVLRVGTNEYARSTISGSLKPGVNFALYVHLDDGNGTAYSPHALHSGDSIKIIVIDEYGEKTIMETNAIPAVGQPGETILVNVTAGTDSDHDGLPDEWEKKLLESGTQTSILDIHPNDDFDGDGVSNWKEYLAGTIAYMANDYFFIENQEITPNGRLRLEYLSVPGKIYWVESTTNLSENIWITAPFATSDEGSLRTAPLIGDGNWQYLYLPLTGPSRQFKLKVQ